MGKIGVTGGGRNGIRRAALASGTMIGETKTAFS